ncbi:hypothetical protein HK100_009709, partial [Physocladia obscura]
EKEFPWNYNDPTCRRSQSPSFNGLTNARSLARLAELVRRSHSETDPIALVSKETFDVCFTPRAAEYDAAVGFELSFTKIGTGYFVRGFGDEEFYGWAGAGGSLVIFSLRRQITFSFAMNFAYLQPLGDVRTSRLIREVLRIVDERKKKL